MSKIALATAVVALTAAVPFTMERGEAQPPSPYLPPGAAPPWGATTTTTTETPPAPTAPATPAAQPPPPSAEPGTTAPIQGTTIQVPAMPLQGVTTPIHAVSLRAGPDTSAPIVGALEPGMPLNVLSTANYGWVQVESPVGAGWAYGSYLAPPGSTAVIQHPAPPPATIAR